MEQINVNQLIDNINKNMAIKHLKKLKRNKYYGIFKKMLLKQDQQYEEETEEEPETDNFVYDKIITKNFIRVYYYLNDIYKYYKDTYELENSDIAYLSKIRNYKGKNYRIVSMFHEPKDYYTEVEPTIINKYKRHLGDRIEQNLESYVYEIDALLLMIEPDIWVNLFLKYYSENFNYTYDLTFQLLDHLEYYIKKHLQGTMTDFFLNYTITDSYKLQLGNEGISNIILSFKDNIEKNINQSIDKIDYTTDPLFKDLLDIEKEYLNKININIKFVSKGGNLLKLLMNKDITYDKINNQYNLKTSKSYTKYFEGLSDWDFDVKINFKNSLDKMDIIYNNTICDNNYIYIYQLVKEAVRYFLVENLKQIHTIDYYSDLNTHYKKCINYFNNIYLIKIYKEQEKITKVEDRLKNKLILNIDLKDVDDLELLELPFNFEIIIIQKDSKKVYNNYTDFLNLKIDKITSLVLNGSFNSKIQTIISKEIKEIPFKDLNSLILYLNQYQSIFFNNISLNIIINGMSDNLNKDLLKKDINFFEINQKSYNKKKILSNLAMNNYFKQNDCRGEIFNCSTYLDKNICKMHTEYNLKYLGNQTSLSNGISDNDFSIFSSKYLGTGKFKNYLGPKFFDLTRIYGGLQLKGLLSSSKIEILDFGFEVFNSYNTFISTNDNNLDKFILLFDRGTSQPKLLYGKTPVYLLHELVDIVNYNHDSKLGKRMKRIFKLFDNIYINLPNLIQSVIYTNNKYYENLFFKYLRIYSSQIDIIVRPEFNNKYYNMNIIDALLFTFIYNNYEIRNYIEHLKEHHIFKLMAMVYNMIFRLIINPYIKYKLGKKASFIIPEYIGYKEILKYLSNSSIIGINFPLLTSYLNNNDLKILIPLFIDNIYNDYGKYKLENIKIIKLDVLPSMTYMGGNIKNKEYDFNY